MLAITALILFPIYWMVTISLKMPRDIYRLPSLWVENPTLDNYRELIDEKEFLTNIRNSLIVASTVTITSLIVSSFAAYSVVRFKYRFKGLVGRDHPLRLSDAVLAPLHSRSRSSSPGSTWATRSTG